MTHFPEKSMSKPDDAITNFLFSLRDSGNVFLTVETTTTPKVKADCPFPNIVKHQRMNGSVQFNYANAKRKHIAKQGGDPSTVSVADNWHEPVLTEDGRVTALCRSKKTGEFYLRMLVTQRPQVEYLNERGVRIPYGIIKKFLRPTSGEALEFRCVKIANIKAVTTNGVTIRRA